MTPEQLQAHIEAQIQKDTLLNDIRPKYVFNYVFNGKAYNTHPAMLPSSAATKAIRLLQSLHKSGIISDETFLIQMDLVRINSRELEEARRLRVVQQKEKARKRVIPPELRLEREQLLREKRRLRAEKSRRLKKERTQLANEQTKN